MRQINVIKRDKKHFQYYHKKVWNKIIEYIKRDFPDNNTLIYSSVIYEYKYEAFKEIFNIEEGIRSQCFGCHWSKISIEDNECYCKDCLFKIKYKKALFEYDSERQCLNGLYFKLIDSDNNLNVKEYIKICIKIRDFPIK